MWGLSKLKYHKFRHNSKGKMELMCAIDDGIEDTEYLLLSCHSYDVRGHNRLGNFNAILLTNGLSNL